MNFYSFTQCSDGLLLKELAASVGREREATAVAQGQMAIVLAQIAEADARKLYLPAAHPSMVSYCVHVLGFKEPVARKRIQAARAAHCHPAIFPAVADGRLTLSAVIELAAHLSAENAEELIAAAAGKSKWEIKTLLADRARMRKSSQPVLAADAAAVFQFERDPDRVDGEFELVGETGSAAPEGTASRGFDPRCRMTELLDGESDLRLVLPRDDSEQFRYLVSLLSNQVAPGDLVEAFRRILAAATLELEKRKFSATSQPRKQHVASLNPRHIPNEVKREVWKRDGGRCSFVSDGGHRCPAQDQLEYDHVLEVSRGGKSVLSNVRLLCRAHNQFHSEQTFGTDFMQTKRARRQEEARVLQARSQSEAPDLDDSDEADVIACLRRLGYRDKEARSAAVFSRAEPPTPIEDRIRRALAFFQPKGRKFSAEENAAQLASMT